MIVQAAPIRTCRLGAATNLETNNDPGGGGVARPRNLSRVAIVWIAALLTLVCVQALPGHAAEQNQRVVLIGVPGLMWSDLSPARTPALWRLTGGGAGAALSTRTTGSNTCPADGWLTVSAGQRARMLHGICALPPAPKTTSSGSAVVPGWATIKKDNAGTAYEAQVGLLGDAVRDQGGCTTAVGPGGVFGAADTSGKVDHYYQAVESVPASAWSQCGLAAVDIDDIFRAFISMGVDARGAQVPVTLDQRMKAVQTADQRIGEVVAALPSGTTVLVAGISDATATPHLHVALQTGKPGYLTATSTLRTGLVTLNDVTSTVLAMLGLKQPVKAIGSDWSTVRSSDSTQTKVRNLTDQDVAAQAVSRWGGTFFIVLFAIELILYGLGTLAVRHRRAIGPTRVLALAVAAAPIATFLTNLVPWWRAGSPGTALICCVVGLTAVVTALSLAGPWRRSVLWPGLIIAGLSGVVLGLDVLTGSTLQLNSFMGYSALVGGRFYGFGNMAFAVFATGMLLTAAWLSELAGRGERRVAVAVVVVIGLVAMALDGFPSWGADFGGVLAIVVAFAVLGLMVAGRRVSVPKVALFGLAGLAVVLAIAFADALRPAAQQTHLGKFWEQLQSGDALGTVTRKFGAMLHSLSYWQFTVVTIAALIFLYAVEHRGGALKRTYAHSTGTRPGLCAVLTVAVLGMLMNDSGVEIPALTFTVMVPLLLAASLRALELDGVDDGADTSTPTPPAPRPAPTA